jgi:4-phytase/acid phosphatase
LHHALWLAPLALALPLSMAAQRPTPSSDRLKLVVILSRHGVRSPTWTQDRLNAYSALPWPTWPAAPGELTPHGYDLLTRFGGYERSLLAAEGLFASTGCAGAALTTIYADTDQRTLASGHALAEGLFPGCAPQIHSLPPGENDPLFHADTSAVPAAQKDAALAELNRRIANNAVHFDPTLIPPLQHVLSGCAPLGACTPAHPPATLLSTAPLVAEPGKGDHIADLRGPLPNASTLSEDLLLEYTDGMPLADVGWGHVDEAQLRRLLALHTACFDLLHRTPALARLENAGLLQSIGLTLRQAVEDRPIDGAIGTPGQRLVVLVGHDTNLAGIAALLGLHWTLDGRTDDTPPGTELAFQLWQTAPGQYVVRTVVTLQTLPQMRERQPLSAKNPPARTAVHPASCPSSHNGCAWPVFLSLLPTP